LNGVGQLGIGTVNTTEMVPVKVLGDHQFVRVSAGTQHTCGIDDAAAAFCWGDNRLGQVGKGSLTGPPISDRDPLAQLVAGGYAFSQLDAGHMHTCALASEGRAYCWGWNYFGQLGNGVLGPQEPGNPVPQLVLASQPFNFVGAGIYHSCGATASGQIFCWGGNNFGQLGDGSFETRLVPVQVPAP
jgi:alpha-tubulin suppressor-like RCC1 family protein